MVPLPFFAMTKRHTTSQRQKEAALGPIKSVVAQRISGVNWATGVLSPSSRSETISTAALPPRELSSTTHFHYWDALEGLGKFLDIFAEEQISTTESTETSKLNLAAGPSELKITSQAIEFIRTNYLSSAVEKIVPVLEGTYHNLERISIDLGSDPEVEDVRWLAVTLRLRGDIIGILGSERVARKALREKLGLETCSKFTLNYELPD